MATSGTLIEALDAALMRLRREPSYGAYAAVGNTLRRFDDAPLPRVRLSVLRNVTLEPLVPVLEGELALAGLHAEIKLGEFDNAVQEAIDPDSAIYQWDPHVIIIALWLEGLSPALATGFPSLSRDAVHAEVERVMDTVRQIVSNIRQHTQVPILLNNFPLPVYPAHGIADAQSALLQTQTVLDLNRRLLAERAGTKDLYLVDWMVLAARVGAANAWDRRTWQTARAPIGRRALIDFGRSYAALVRALRGRSRKCLVLDCDNTLWGGVVGEDGLHGLALGTSHPGSSFQAFQREILNLHDRGVVLALCSKNNEADVLEVLRKHPDMLLREEHIAAFQINWDDKVMNLRRLAEELNLGIDSFVFVDDSEFECNMVLERLPEVAVVHLAGDPSGFCDLLSAGAHFDTLVVTDEDRRRNRMYRDERERRRLRQNAASLDDYLASLGLVAEIGLANSMSTPRLAQLSQKTNQFNLTTCRYSEADILAFASDPSVRVFSLRLRDRVADLGLVGLVIVRIQGDLADIDTFLMSCRALGRGAEVALLAHVCEASWALGCTRVLGRYRPTAKNGQVAGFFEKHGFRRCGEDEQGVEWMHERGRAPDIVAPRWIEIQQTHEESERANHR